MNRAMGFCNRKWRVPIDGQRLSWCLQCVLKIRVQSTCSDICDDIFLSSVPGWTRTNISKESIDRGKYNLFSAYMSFQMFKLYEYITENIKFSVSFKSSWVWRKPRIFQSCRHCKNHWKSFLDLTGFWVQMLCNHLLAGFWLFIGKIQWHKGPELCAHKITNPVFHWQWPISWTLKSFKSVSQ